MDIMQGMKQDVMDMNLMIVIHQLIQLNIKMDIQMDMKREKLN